MTTEKTLIKVQVSYSRESANAFGVLVNLIFDANGKNISASDLRWFPKSLCVLEKIEPNDCTKEMPTYFLTAPKWLIEKTKQKK